MGDLLTSLPTDKVEPSETERQAVQLLFPPKASSAPRSSPPPSLANATRWSWCTDRAHLRRCLVAGVLFCALTALATQPLLDRLLQATRLAAVASTTVLRVVLFLVLVWLLAR